MPHISKSGKCLLGWPKIRVNGEAMRNISKVLIIVVLVMLSISGLHADFLQGPFFS
jgi:hypothetical protein